tara:strand:+ start:187 stop:627 length:441 start_codon:yes stop_codon:yes gene_type:complete
MGLVTESVELLNFNSEKNFLEELGDILWYTAIAASHLNLTLEEVSEVVDSGSPPPDSIEALVTDSAEVLDLMKKSIFYGRPLDHQRVAQLLANILDSVEVCAVEFETTLDDVMEKNIAKLQKRFPEGFFTSEAANNRDVNTEMSVY